MQPWWWSEGVQGSSAEASAGRCWSGGRGAWLRLRTTAHGCPGREWPVQSDSYTRG